MSVIIYGIKQCDTMKKAFAQLDEQGVSYVFHDYKKQGICAEKLESWLKQVEWEVLVNRRGTTWRKLSEEDKAAMDKDSAIAAMIANPSLIKRPVIEDGDDVVVGFNKLG